MRRNAWPATPRAARAAARPAPDRWSAASRSPTASKPTKTIANYYAYATTVFDYIRRAMPYNAPRSLNDNEVYALTAYILSLNKLIGENDTMDAQDPAAGADAQPGQFHPALSGPHLTLENCGAAGFTAALPSGCTVRSTDRFHDR